MARRRASTSAARRSGRPRRPPVLESLALVRYIESSALVAALLENDPQARASLRATGRRVTSAVTFAEAARAIIRARVAGRLSDVDTRAAVRALQVFERRTAIVDVTTAVLARARRPFPAEPVRTLDAVHLATAEIVAESPQLATIVTRDGRVRENALALGYAVE